MNLDEAIAAHSAWKQKLAVYVAKPDKSIDVATLGKDNQCDLGKWIASEAAHYASEPVFQELCNVHANFHHAAAAIVRRADAGEKVSVDVSLGAKSTYADLSRKVVQAILRMKQLVSATTALADLCRVWASDKLGPARDRGAAAPSSTAFANPKTVQRRSARVDQLIWAV
jgi:hypothetical protein